MRQMSMERYVKSMQARYGCANRKGKKEILNQFCSFTNYHRKHATWILNHKIFGEHKASSGRKKEYEPELVLEPLKRLWLATDQMCGKRLKVAIPLWLPYYDAIYGYLNPKVKFQLLKMSAATIDRLLLPSRHAYPHRRLSGTKPGTLLKRDIPIKTDQWNETKPGFVEADTVAHCGTSLLGNFVWSVTMTDIFSGWTENGATWNKGAHGVLEQIRLIEQRLPFPILGYDCDNGSEFINHHLVRYFKERKKPVQFTRSRPYHKGDNAHVEQKNWTHVRQLFGYYRFSDPILVELMNDLYHNEWPLLHNYFYPSAKLIDKIRIKSHIKKKHLPPSTPYQRLMNSQDISPESKAYLYKTFQSLNPFELRQAIEKKLKIIFSYVDLKIRKQVVSI